MGGRVPVKWQAAQVLAVAHARRLRGRLSRSRHQLVSMALVVAGMGGAAGGGALIGAWCLGLVLIAESCGLIWVGLMRDDGQARPVFGARTLAQVLDDERLRL